MSTEHEQEFREEAERLRHLSREDQESFVAMLRRDAANGRVPKSDRDFARERADALERLLAEPALDPATPVPPANPLHQGSTRMRLFKALKKFSDGLTPSTIKTKTGMLPRSGNLYDLLLEEVEARRISKSVASDENEKNHTIYLLTAKGLKDLAEGKIDKNAYAGKRIGQARIKKESKKHPE